MRLRIIPVAYIMLVLSLFVRGNPWAANGINPVVFDGVRLSVNAKGMYLGELLMAVENVTGIQFTFNELVGGRKIFLDFEDLPLKKGIKKIVHPLSFAAIYDETGKLRKVIILGQWKSSGMGAAQEERDNSMKVPKAGPSDSVSFAMPPNTQNEMPEDLPVPDIGGSGHLPIPDSEGAPSGGMPQNTQNKMGEDLPVPDIGGSGHLPIPDSTGPRMESPPEA